MNINVVGLFIVLQAISKKMAEENDRSKNYSIVNTASVAGMRGTPAMVAYSSSKAAVITMTVSSAKDLAPHGIRVNAISPGESVKCNVQHVRRHKTKTSPPPLLL